MCAADFSTLQWLPKWIFNGSLIRGFEINLHQLSVRSGINRSRVLVVIDWKGAESDKWEVLLTGMFFQGRFAFLATFLTPLHSSATMPTFSWRSFFFSRILDDPKPILSPEVFVEPMSFYQLRHLATLTKKEQQEIKSENFTAVTQIVIDGLKDLQWLVKKNPGVKGQTSSLFSKSRGFWDLVGVPLLVNVEI